MKKCNKCKQKKSLSEFAVNNSKKDGLGGTCKLCHNEYTRNHYKNNREQYLLKNIKRRNFNKDFCNRVKSIKKCQNCNEKRYWVLEYHHIHNKKENISILAHQGTSIKTLKNEIRKCIILCANCHKDMHYKERIDL